MFGHIRDADGAERRPDDVGSSRTRGIWILLPGLLVVGALGGIPGELIGDGAEPAPWRAELEEMGLLPPPWPSARPAAGARDAREGIDEGADAPTFRADATLFPLRARDLARGHRSPEASDREAIRFVAGRSEFAVRFRDDRLSYGVMGVTALPGQPVEIAVDPGAPARAYRLSYEAGSALEGPGSSWWWTPPAEPGVYAVQVTDPETFEFVHMNVFVLHPRDQVVNGVLGGYRIGRYPSRPLGGDPAYEPPDGFIEVGEEERDVLVSPHFTLEQFLCHQPGEPKFLALSHPLVLKLEAILERLNAEGYRAPTLHVMSGFRTPHYHRRILGRSTSYSRHMYGDAADIFVDVDGNRLMDDLNGDGYSGMSDNRILARIVDEVEREGIPGVKIGGMGLYRGRSSGPFVHVDARGERVRW